MGQTWDYNPRRRLSVLAIAGLILASIMGLVAAANQPATVIGEPDASHTALVEQSYLQALHSMAGWNITAVVDRDAALVLGRQICARNAAGDTVPAIAAQIAVQPPARQYRPGQLTAAVRATQIALCPEIGHP